MNPTHISLNPHFNELPYEVQNIEKYVFLQKESNFLVAKRRYIEEQIAFCQDEHLKTELKSDLEEVEEDIRFVQLQIPDGAVQELNKVISAYMQLYRLTVEEMAKQSGVSPDTVIEALKTGFLTEESRKFAFWSIRTFRLDANLYLHLFCT